MGSLAGALLIYGIARRGGRGLLLRHGRFLGLGESDLSRADDLFDRHGAWIVLGGRLVPGAHSLVSIPAGLSQMPLARFALLTTIGSALWNTALIGAGSALGSNYREIGDAIGPVGPILLVLLLVFLVGAGAWWMKRRSGRQERD